jgi:hypothetical protein
LGASPPPTHAMPPNAKLQIETTSKDRLRNELNIVAFI